MAPPRAEATMQRTKITSKELADLDKFITSIMKSYEKDTGAGADSVLTVAGNKSIKLNIGGRIFVTTRNTLCAESGLFRRQLSGDFTWKPEADGSYFLDADPDLFEHLLRFMRRPEVFPLFYTNAAGLDYDLYNRLETEALYFQINTLYDWLKGKKYLLALVATIHAPKVHDFGSGQKTYPASAHGSEYHSLTPRVRKTYLCPRRIPVHRGNRSRCGAACHRVQGEKEDDYEEENYMELVTVHKEITFDNAVCRLEYGSVGDL
jgi:hypothetical protein